MWRVMMDKKELLKIIDDAAKNNVTKLDLSWKSITELPEEIGKLTNLTRLGLENTQLTSLPEAIEKLAS